MLSYILAQADTRISSGFSAKLKRKETTVYFFILYFFLPPVLVYSFRCYSASERSGCF